MNHPRWGSIGAASVLLLCIATPIAAVAPGAHQTGAPRTIAFVSRSGIWLVAGDGSNPRHLTAGSSDRWPAWSPDGDVVAFVREPRKGSGQLRTVGADRSDERLVIDRWPGVELSWSPDGRSFAYYCQGDGSIHVMNTDGSGDVAITRSHATGDPAWSPDGTEIAYEAPVDGRFHIFVSSPDGTHRTVVTRGAGPDESPAWSPDGTRILFSRWRRGEGWDLYSVDLATSVVRRLTRTPDVDETDASWSPDGTQVAYIRHRYGDRRSFLFLMSSDGADRMKLVDRPATGLAWAPA